MYSSSERVCSRKFQTFMSPNSHSWLQSRTSLGGSEVTFRKRSPFLIHVCQMVAELPPSSRRAVLAESHSPSVSSLRADSQSMTSLIQARWTTLSRSASKVTSAHEKISSSAAEQELEKRPFLIFWENSSGTTSESCSSKTRRRFNSLSRT